MVNYFSPTDQKKYNADPRKIRYEYDQTLTYIDTELVSDPIIVPTEINKIITTLYIDTGIGKVQTSTNKISDIIDNKNVVWDDWDAGEVTQTIKDYCTPISAMRFICKSGTVRIMAIAQ